MKSQNIAFIFFSAIMAERSLEEEMKRQREELGRQRHKVRAKMEHMRLAGVIEEESDEEYEGVKQGESTRVKRFLQEDALARLALEQQEEKARPAREDKEDRERG